MYPKSFKRLEERRQNGNLRMLDLHSGQIDFYSNDYLGISNFLEKINFPGGGSTGSRLISGNSVEAEKLEAQLADFFGAEAALVFNSGYDANLGLFSSIAQRNDTIIYDELIHASIRDGIRLGTAKSFSFRHNDLGDLQKKMDQAHGDIFVVVESLYSMDGDHAPLLDLGALSEEKSFFLVVDEAHAGGIYGEEGRGLVNQLRIESFVFARIVTFGKAYGTHGAVVLGSEQLKQYLINFARSFVYTTAMAPSQYELIGEALIMSRDTALREKLQERIRQFREALKGITLESDESSPIQIIRKLPNKELYTLFFQLQENKIACKFIKSPTVQKGKECLRICIHAFNTEDEVNLLTSILLS